MRSALYGNKKSGFTLIEIIAVLVIIGMLASVAIPRYLNLIENAKIAVLEGGVITGHTQCTLVFGKLSLRNNGGRPPSAAEVAAEARRVARRTGNIKLLYRAGGDVVRITAIKAEWPRLSASGTWNIPGMPSSRNIPQRSP